MRKALTHTLLSAIVAAAYLFPSSIHLSTGEAPMSDPTMLPEAPTYCPHPDCTEVLRDSDGTVHHRGGACPTHQEWFAYAVAACNAGDGGAMEAYAASDARHPEHLVIDTTEADDMSAGAIADGIVDVGGFSY